MPQKQDPQTEILQRTRRIETRLTKMMIGLGVATETQKPQFTGNDGGRARIVLPSPHSSLQEIASCVPPGWCGLVDVYLGGDRIVTLDYSR
jgi:hypothetical protein